MVRRNAASVAREVCKHTPELAQLIVATGGVAALVDNISEVTGNERLPGTSSCMLFHPILCLSNSLTKLIIEYLVERLDPYHVRCHTAMIINQYMLFMWPTSC